MEGNLAIVTGSSRGIGLATSNQLLDLGMKVAGWSRSGTSIDHPNFLDIRCDVSDKKEIESAYSSTKEAFGVPFSLINNAGLGYSYALEETPIEIWDKMFAINVRGLYLCTKAVLPDMKIKEEGHIINISSISGTMGIEMMAGYCGTKHAVRGISHSLYKEVRKFGIKVSCIYPGSVQTNFFDEIDSVQANENMMQPEDIASSIVHMLGSNPNYHHVDLEVRPLQPGGKKR